VQSLFHVSLEPQRLRMHGSKLPGGFQFGQRLWEQFILDAPVRQTNAFIGIVQIGLCSKILIRLDARSKQTARLGARQPCLPAAFTRDAILLTNLSDLSLQKVLVW
jgi:hypothetical protein